MENFNNIEEQRRWNDPEMWTDSGHEWSGSFGSTENLWNTYLFDTLKRFRGLRILEIAPGHGRITQFLSILTSDLIVVDLNENCISETKKRLGNHVSKYYVNDGKSLPFIEDNSIDLVFSFDSFVHMHRNVVRNYVSEIKRVLKPYGYGYIHHSNLVMGKELSFQNWAGRANMNPYIFKTYVEEENMKIISQIPIKFDSLGGWNGEDTLSLFYKER